MRVLKFGGSSVATPDRIDRAAEIVAADYKFVTLSHNTVRGGAGGAVLLAELAVERNWLEREETR